MANILDYIEWRGDLSMSVDEFNDIDNLILSQLSYLNFEGIIPGEEGGSILLREAARKYLSDADETRTYTGLLVSPQTVTLLKKAAESARFSGIKLSKYVNKINEEEQKQFSAVTCLLEDNTVYVAYRGTDDTIVGWKEDFNMSFISPVPSQTEAVEYLEKTQRRTYRKIRIGGHSKGGNLAVYASAFCNKNIQRRIIGIYNNDGPGFELSTIEKEGFRNIISVVKTIVPQSSIVGMLLEHEEDYVVIQSTQTGIFQHDAFSWQLVGRHFIELDSTDARSRRIDKAIKTWLNSLEKEEIERFVDELFNLITATGAKTLTDLTKDRGKNIGALLKALSDMDETTHKNLAHILKKLFIQK